ARVDGRRALELLAAVAPTQSVDLLKHGLGRRLASYAARLGVGDGGADDLGEPTLRECEVADDVVDRPRVGRRTDRAALAGYRVVRETERFVLLVDEREQLGESRVHSTSEVRGDGVTADAGAEYAVS